MLEIGSEKMKNENDEPKGNVVRRNAQPNLIFWDMVSGSTFRW